MWKRSLALVLMVAVSPALWAQTKVKPGFNLASLEDDVEIGRRSATEIERQLPMLRDATVNRYVSKVGKRLAAVVQGPDFPYQFKVANQAAINAFALPGGFMYINRGLIEAAENEAELAGVMAHEMAHVALRHGTNRVSKAQLAQLGLGAVGAVLGGGGGTGLQQAISAAGGFGLNALFLKYSRKAETQSDIVGTQMLHRSGYDGRLLRNASSGIGQGPGEAGTVLQQPSGSEESGGSSSGRDRTTGKAPTEGSSRRIR